MGFSLQIYALVWTTLLPSAVNLVQEKNQTDMPWLHSEPKKKYPVIKKQVCYTEFWTAFNFHCTFPHTLDELQAHAGSIQRRDFKSYSIKKLI